MSNELHTIKDCQVSLISYYAKRRRLTDRSFALSFQSLVNKNRNFQMTGEFRKVSNSNRVQGPVSQKYRKIFGPEKPFLKLPHGNSVGLLICCKGNKK